MSYSLISWPALLSGPSATLAALLATLERTQYLHPNVMIKQQEQQMQLMIRHHYDNSPHFRARVDAAGLSVDDLKTIRDLSKLPPITKRDLQDAGDRFRCEKIPEDHGQIGLASTSGSTGEPVDVNKTEINQMFWMAMAIRDHSWFKRDPRMRMSSIRANNKEYGIWESWGRPMSMLTRTGQCQSIPIGTDTIKANELLKQFQPDILIAHAGMLNGLAALWEKDGFELAELKHIKSMGDNCHEDLRERLKAVTGLSPEDNYSSSEVGCIAIQCPVSGQYHIMSETLIVEILDQQGKPCRPGQAGRVVVTDLHNAAAPLIRYDLGDHAEVGSGCKCGRTLPTLSKILGRERGLFHRPDGSRFWPKAGRYKMVEVADVRQWQMIQHSLDLLEIRIVTDEPLTDLQIQAMQDLMREQTKLDCEVKVTESRELLPLSKSGKFEESICLIRD
jgi:phenylacetate-CoA ligase